MTLLYILSGIWIFLFIFISYGNYLWWENGSNNLFWGPAIKLTFVALLLLGGLISALVPRILLHVEPPAVYVNSLFAIPVGVMVAALSVILMAKIITFPSRLKIAKAKEYQATAAHFYAEESLSPISELFQSKEEKL